MPLIVIAKITAKPALVQPVKEALLALLAPTQQEAGNVEYTLYQGALDPCQFMMYEVWEDQDAFQTHNQMPYLKDFIKKSGPWLSQEIAIKTIAQ